ncbi:hypothetical protein MRX96_053069, partial [Rhipicephalus microplus]
MGEPGYFAFGRLGCVAFGALSTTSERRQNLENVIGFGCASRNSAITARLPPWNQASRTATLIWTGAIAACRLRYQQHQKSSHRKMAMRPSSVTSHHVSILEATKGREPASHPSGPGSSTTGGMLSNPFCFVLQVLAVLQEIRLSQRGCLPGIKQAELLRRYGPEPSPLADYGISSIKSPHTARWPLRPSSVTSHHVSILEATKGREPASHPSGPGSSTTGGMLSNPFCFVLQ